MSSSLTLRHSFSVALLLFGLSLSVSVTPTTFDAFSSVPTSRNSHSTGSQTQSRFPILNAAQIASFRPFTFFASAGYCHSAVTANWSCGANCDANADFEPTASGGDGTDVQFWYVGYEPTLNTVIVVHQGTNPVSILADATDINFFQISLNTKLFPGLDPSILVHGGFADEHAKTAQAVLRAVSQTLSSHPGASVTCVGHSLGAAISLLDAVFLPLHLPASTTFKMVGYGLPRVGNKAFANYVDSTLGVSTSGNSTTNGTSLLSTLTFTSAGTVVDPGLTHINNQEDPVPIVPGRELGFVHPWGEVHIQDSGEWVSCPGQDNNSTECSTGDVPSVFEGDVGDHDGPYGGVKIGC